MQADNTLHQVFLRQALQRGAQVYSCALHAAVSVSCGLKVLGACAAHGRWRPAVAPQPGQPLPAAHRGALVRP